MEITSTIHTEHNNSSRLNRKLPFLLLIGLLAWTIGWYWSTATSIEAIWSKSETFQHGYLIIPISLWLIWQKRDRLSEIEVKPVYWPLAVLTLIGLGWLLADLAEVSVVRQYALVMMLPAIVTLILGTKFARAISFPLAFLLLTVPFGEFLLPPLMNFTADFTVSALRLTGIPVFREGNNFSLPTGNWSVVEACSGLRYLIAAFTLGCLYAYLTYRKLSYRLICIAVSLIVPILANGLRAYMIVMLGHLSGMQLAVGVDHLIYGWLFFGLVIILMFWIGSFWREDLQPESKKQKVESIDVPQASMASTVTATLLGGLILAAWPVYADYLNHLTDNRPIHLPEFTIKGWQKVNEPLSDWKPHYQFPRAETTQFFEKDGQKVGVYIAYYNNQNEKVKLISSTNVLTISSDRKWFTVESKKTSAQVNGSNLALQESEVKSLHSTLQVWHWYWIGGINTNNGIYAKLLQAVSKFLKRGDNSAIVVLYTPVESPSSNTTLLNFTNDAMAVIEQSLINTTHR